MRKPPSTAWDPTDRLDGHGRGVSEWHSQHNLSPPGKMVPREVDTKEPMLAGMKGKGSGGHSVMQRKDRQALTASLCVHPLS